MLSERKVSSSSKTALSPKITAAPKTGQTLIRIYIYTSYTESRKKVLIVSILSKNCKFHNCSNNCNVLWGCRYWSE